jgi:hypothetical protein
MKKYAIPALLAATLAVPAFAQAPAPQPDGPDARPPHRAEHRPRDAHGPMARMCGDADARLSARLAYIETSLKLKPDQMPAFDAFARDSRAAREPMKQLCDKPPARAARGDVAGMLAARERFAKAMVDSLSILRPAVERFQAALDEAQKSKFARAFMMWQGGPRDGRDRAHARH